MLELINRALSSFVFNSTMRDIAYVLTKGVITKEHQLRSLRWVAIAVAIMTLSGQAPAPAPTSAIPPIALQGCAQKVKAKHARLFANSNATSTTVSGSAQGDQIVGFDVSFVNTTEKVAKIVVIRIGETDFTKIGQFSPDAVIAWRIAAHPGDCYVQAVRFVDGTEWTAPDPAPPAPAPLATP